MSSAGRKPKPTAMKELAGNPGKRPLNQREPKPRVVIPPCPKWLQGEARAEYKRTARMLVNLRVMTEADRVALAAYAHQYAKWLEAERMVQEQGAVLISDKGGAYINPWQNIANGALKTMRSLMAEFGMTPASRTRISAEPDDSQPKSLAEQLFELAKND